MSRGNLSDPRQHFDVPVARADRRASVPSGLSVRRLRSESGGLPSRHISGPSSRIHESYGSTSNSASESSEDPSRRATASGPSHLGSAPGRRAGLHSRTSWLSVRLPSASRTESDGLPFRHISGLSARRERRLPVRHISGETPDPR
jgi:hypothetical protein